MMATRLILLATILVGVLSTKKGVDNDPTYYSFITAGQAFSCGVLEATGRVECWGGGALGDVPSLDVLESKLLDENHLSISGGGFHACGLYYNGEERKANVEAYCVASYEDGAPQDAGQLDIPDIAASGLVWREISAGGQHTCGIDSDRMVHCWGSEEGNRRALGDMAHEEHLHISAGGLATCGVLLDGMGYCVGDVPQGMLPTEYDDVEFKMLEAGGAFSYGLVKTSKGVTELIKFGPGEAAGDPFLIVESIPLTPPEGFRSTKTHRIAAGAVHVCAIGRRNRKAIEDGKAKRGAWCAGTGGEEITGISPSA